MLKLIAMATCLMAVSPAFAQSAVKRTGTSLSTAAFVKEAAISDMFETQSSELAAIRANEQTRMFAAKMNEDHQKSSSELAMLVKPHFAQTPIPSNMDSSHQKMLATLKGLQADAFTRRYQEYQVTAHKDAVSLFRRYADGGDDAQLREWAKRMLPILQEHLKMAQSLGR